MLERYFTKTADGGRGAAYARTYTAPTAKAIRFVTPFAIAACVYFTGLPGPVTAAAPAARGALGAGPRAQPALSRRTAAGGGTSADPTVAANWLAQKVCVAPSGSVARIDPYSSGNAFGDACPAGYAIRNLREADTLPYYKYYNPIGPGAAVTRYRYTNAYEIQSASGQTLYVMDRQFQPSNVPVNWYVDQSFYPGSSQWDTYEIADGWVSGATTRDNTGLNQTFYGDLGGTPTPYNGWVDFPLAYLARIGADPHWESTYVPIDGVYWQQAGLPFPTPSQAMSTQNPGTQTTWKLLPAYAFDSGKTMNALVSYHQSQPLPSDANPDNGHIEAWFFTVPYGPTRWEVWSAASCLASSCKSYIQSSCKTPSATMEFGYKGASYKYYRTNCVDWEQGTALVAAPSSVPTLPVPQANPLTNFSFADDPVDTSGVVSGWNVGGSLALAQLQSKYSGDTRQGKYAGVRYVKIACKAACSAAASLSQSVAVRGSGVYSFGVEARSEASTGFIAVALTQTNAAGSTLATAGTMSEPVNSVGDGSNCATLPRIENCELYVGERVPVQLLPGATRLRITVTPLTAGIAYDLTDVFLGAVRQ